MDFGVYSKGLYDCTNISLIKRIRPISVDKSEIQRLQRLVKTDATDRPMQKIIISHAQSTKKLFV